MRRNQDVGDDPITQSLYGFFLERCARVTFEKLAVAAKQQTVSQGVVKLVSEGPRPDGVEEAGIVSDFVDIAIQNGFTTPDLLNRDRPVGNDVGRYLRKYDRDEADLPFVPAQFSNNVQIPWDFTEKVTGTARTFRMWVRNSVSTSYTPPFAVGESVAVRCKHGKDLFRFMDCRIIFFSDVRLIRKIPNTLSQLHQYRDRPHGM